MRGRSLGDEVASASDKVARGHPTAKLTKWKYDWKGLLESLPSLVWGEKAKSASEAK